jgi:hypothetical protein
VYSDLWDSYQDMSMKRIISVVTPAYAPRRDQLEAAYESIRQQVLPSEWQWQWVVQEDDQSGRLADVLPDDDRISPGSGRHAGPAAARNLCLARATGEFIKVLDADDQLLPGALARDIQVLTASPAVAWTTTRALDLLPDGSTAEFASNPLEGRIERGEILQFWRSHNYQAQVHPATLCMRRRLLIALGGWMALPASEDTGLLIAANAVAPGYFIATPGLLYRKWPGQATMQPEHIDEIERSARMAIIEERAEALASLCKAVRHSGPEAGKESSHHADRQAVVQDVDEDRAA